VAKVDRHRSRGDRTHREDDPLTLALSLGTGAALLALWLDCRFEDWRPSSLLHRIAHVGLAYVALRLMTAGAGHLVGEDPSDTQRFGIVFLVFLPGIMYAFLSGLWLMRALADAVGVARH